VGFEFTEKKRVIDERVSTMTYTFGVCQTEMKTRHWDFSVAF